MRVTRLIKEYVTKEVKDFYEPIIEEVIKDYNETRKEDEKIVNSIVEKAEKEIIAFLTEKGYDNPSRVGFLRSFALTKSKESTEIYKKQNAIRKERDKKIADILVTLEMGGTKADLDKMLAEIKEKKEV